MPGFPSQLGNAPVAGTTMAACVSSMTQAAQRHGGSGAVCSEKQVLSNVERQFWIELPPQNRQELLRIDKQTLFEQARKNLYCSRCNGMLLECFTQIVMYGKSLHQDFVGFHHTRKSGNGKPETDDSDAYDPSVHPWGGLVAARDGTLSLLDCYIYRKSFEGLEKVFKCAIEREHERELLYPDACGGGGRGWISHGLVNYGRAHGIRESCALHTARLSCDTLVDFWSALGDETRSSLLRMKEEDFIERLMYRFDSKRFCRDCRKNVIREFKELKELKRMRKETRCTRWFCGADTAFQYEVSDDTVLANWRQSFSDTDGTYHHFEWAIGTGEGKSDILEFEDVGMSGEVQVNGLDLGDLDACFITLRAWRLDGRCTELTGKAHALKGQACVHRRLVVGDGFVAITKGENIRRFFEHAEEAEEEEDDDALDKDGNDIDSDGSRPQKHAKSPELAREFLLDAATVIFKEQVEKAFREGTARQNAHSTFVCLALKLLEDRVHIACKEIITLEKQMKFLEEEEKEKRQEEERRERRRTKEREKKLRRKERLREKDRDREKKHSECNTLPSFVVAQDESSVDTSEESLDITNDGDSNGDLGEPHLTGSLSPNEDGQFSNESYCSKIDTPQHPCYTVDKNEDGEVNNNSFLLEKTKLCRRKLKFNEDSCTERPYRWSDKHQIGTCDRKNVVDNEAETKANGCVRTQSRSVNGFQSQYRGQILKTLVRKSGPRYSEKFQAPKHRMNERYDYQSCSCNQQADYRPRDTKSGSLPRLDRDCKIVPKAEATAETFRPMFRNSKNVHNNQTSDISVVPRTKSSPLFGSISRDGPHTRQVWEPMITRKKCPRDENGADSGSVPVKVESSVSIEYNNHNEFDKPSSDLQEPIRNIPAVSEDPAACVDITGEPMNRPYASMGNFSERSQDFGFGSKPCHYMKDDDMELEPCSVSPTSPIENICNTLIASSSSDNCSSCISEADSSTSCSSARNAESSSTSDSEETSQHLEDVSISNQTAILSHKDIKVKTEGSYAVRVNNGSGFERGQPADVSSSSSSHFANELNTRQIPMAPIAGHGFHSRYVPFTSVGPHNQTPVSWSSLPSNRVVPFPHSHHYLFPNPLAYAFPPLQTPDYRMHYNGLQPLVSPIIGTCQPPMYQTMRKANVMTPNEQANGGLDLNRNSATDAVIDTKKSTQPAENAHSNDEVVKPPSPAGHGNIANSGKSHDSQPFSLFHFGGPITAASRNSSDSTLFTTVATADKEKACLKKDSMVEEYSLFASNTGARFSLL